MKSFMNNSDNQIYKSKNEALEFLRFVSLTEVFLIHYMNDFILSEEGLSIPMVSGKLGVAFFFMISAYLLVVTYRPEKPFLKNKAFQLLPKYEIILLFVFIASQVRPHLFHTFDISTVNFLKSAFLVPYRTEGVPFVCPMLPVAWTLIIQAFVFILFWAIVKISKNQYITAGILSIVFVALAIIGEFEGNELLISFAYCRFYMLYFIIGFCVAIMEHRIKKNKLKLPEVLISKWSGDCNICICIIIAIAFQLLSCVFDDKLFFIPVLFIMFYLAIFKASKLRFPKFILFMGKISYSFFLLHYLIVKVFTRVFPSTREPVMIIIMVIACYGLITAMSWIYDEIINKGIILIKRGKDGSGYNSNYSDKK